MSAFPDNPFISHLPNDPNCLIIQGDWTLSHYAELRRLIAILRKTASDFRQVNLDQLGKLDTAGGQLLAELLGHDLLLRLIDRHASMTEERRTLLTRIAKSIGDEALPAEVRHGALFELLEHTGQATVSVWRHLTHLLAFIGLTLSSLAVNLMKPRNWRITSIVVQIEQIALNAVPIVVLLTFMIGAVIAFLGATVLRDFGATIYTVDLIAFSFLREFGVLLTAILMAGRTASAFTAQIGAMKANEEIDAIRSLGLNPLDILIMPRVLAMLISLPLLTFIAMMSGLLGGALVCALKLAISPAMFLSILQQDVDVLHFYLGMAKAPLFAFLIAMIGCMEGFKVSGSTESVGAHTTSSVVQSIFVVILVDALVALFYMEMGW